MLLNSIMKIKICLAALFLAFTSPLVMAVEGSYFYGAVDYGEAVVSDFCSGVPAGVSCQNKNSGYRASAGYQFISSVGKEGLGLEGSYVNAGKGSFSGSGVSANTTNTEWQLALTGTAPLDNEFILISKAGVARWNLNTTSTPTATGLSPSGVDFIWGLGVQWDLGKTIALRSMFDSHLIGNSITGRGTLSTLTLGALFRF